MASPRVLARFSGALGALVTLALAATMLVVPLPAAAAGTHRAAPTAAHDPNGHPTLSVSPAILDLALQPGTSTVRQLTVSNPGTGTLTVAFQHADFGFNGSSYAPVLIEDDAPHTTRFSTRGWFSIPDHTVHVAAGESTTVPLTIKVPANATKGTHLGAALFRTVTKQANVSAAHVAAAARTGTLIFIAVGGTGATNPELRTFTIARFTTGRLPRATITMGASGTSFYDVSGTLTVSHGDVKRTYAVAGGHVVPGLVRQFHVPGGDHLPGFGKYRVSLTLHTLPDQHTIRATRSLYVVPIWVRVVGVGVIALLLALGIIGVVFGVRARRHRAYALFTAAEDDDFADDFADDDTDDESDEI